MQEQEKMDYKTLKLRDQMVRAQYAYLQHVMPLHEKEFQERLQFLGKVFRKGQPSSLQPAVDGEIDTSEDRKILNELEERECKLIYRQLSMIYHPDRFSKSPRKRLKWHRKCSV